MNKNYDNKQKQKEYNCSELVRTLYIQEQGAVLYKDHERVMVRKGEDVIFSSPAIKIDRIVILGICSITPPFLKFALKNEIPISLLSNMGNCCTKN